MAGGKGKAGDIQPIVIKRIKKVSGGHHGGAWKIAYADFVTAMMAFFLLMWLLGSTTQGDLKGIADYFNTPLKVSMMGGSGSGDATSIIKGGGKDLTRETGQVKDGANKSDRKKHEVSEARQEVERLDRAKLSALKERIDGMLSTSPLLRNFQNQIRLDITSEGLRIQIVDENNRPMFDSGRAVLKDYSRGILHEISRALNEVDNKISISGHTDAQPFVSGDRGYSNWELSADRSNAARREMVMAGIDEQKMVRVVGLASSIPLVPDDPFDPRNRRISIIVLNKKAEEAVMRPVPALDISNSSAVSQQLAPPAAGLPASALSSFPSPRK